MAKKKTWEDEASRKDAAGAEDTQPETAEQDVSDGGETADTDTSDAASETNEEALREERDALEAERDELKDQLLRTVAEYDNYKRRTKREKEQLYTDSVSDVVTAWLPVIDNLERALEACENTEGDEAAALAEGVKMIARQIEDTMTKLGVEEIPADGEMFDPNLHHAVMQVEDDEAEEGRIVDVLAKGYRRGDRVIRHSVVRVAK